VAEQGREEAAPDEAEARKDVEYGWPPIVGNEWATQEETTRTTHIQTAKYCRHCPCSLPSAPRQNAQSSTARIGSPNSYVTAPPHDHSAHSHWDSVGHDVGGGGGRQSLAKTDLQTNQPILHLVMERWEQGGNVLTFKRDRRSGGAPAHVWRIEQRAHTA
jgi:hypothetical protein